MIESLVQHSGARRAQEFNGRAHHHARQNGHARHERDEGEEVLYCPVVRWADVLCTVQGSRPASWAGSERAVIRTGEGDDLRPVVINVGGIRFFVSWNLLDRLPQTRLGRLHSARGQEEILELCDKFNLEDNE